MYKFSCIFAFNFDNAEVIKPRYAAEIAREIAALGLPNVELVKAGQVYEL